MFQWQGKGFQFTCLPFGLLFAQMVFTEMRPVVGFLRSKGMWYNVYIDNHLFKLREFSATYTLSSARITEIFNKLPQVCAWTKLKSGIPWISNQLCGKRIETSEKREKIVVEAKAMLECCVASARSLAQLVGRMTSTILEVHPATLHYLGLQYLKHLAFSRKSYDGQVTMSLVLPWRPVFFWAYLPKNRNSLCLTHLSCKCPTHLSLNAPPI